jgi:alanine racemase
MKTTRRTFLTAGAALPLAGVQSPARRGGESPVHSTLDPWIEVHAGHLRANARTVARHVKVPVLAVIKNNGYGAGVVQVARALEPLPEIRGYAVVKMHEAHVLRDAGVRKPVLLMGPVEEAQIADAARRGIELMVYTPIAAALERAARRVGKTIDVHLCVDTGLGRVGVPDHEAPDLALQLAATRGVAIRGAMMTFTEDAQFDREQLRRFTTLIDVLKLKGVSVGARHAASSYTLFQHPDATLDMVRPGMVLYGIYPEPAFRKMKPFDLTPAIALKTRVAYVKQLRAGDSAGYNRAYMAKAPVWIATLPVGHADGLPRVAAKGGRVRIGGALYPIVASVSASHTIVEIGPERRVEIGDEATLFDWTDGSRPEDLSDACGASVYDLTMHLNPTLPRKVIGP